MNCWMTAGCDASIRMTSILHANIVPAFSARQPFQMEYRFRRADGSYRWILDTGVPRYAPDGTFAGYIGSALDITERRQMEQSLLDNQAALREAYEQNQDLAGRLINAQEEERTRIARDLHDDLSQQLAGVAIMLSGLKREGRQAGPQPEVEQTVATLQERTSALAQTRQEPVARAASQRAGARGPGRGTATSLRRDRATPPAHGDLQTPATSSTRSSPTWRSACSAWRRKR